MRTQGSSDQYELAGPSLPKKNPGQYKSPLREGSLRKSRVLCCQHVPECVFLVHGMRAPSFPNPTAQVTVSILVNLAPVENRRSASVLFRLLQLDPRLLLSRSVEWGLRGKITKGQN